MNISKETQENPEFIEYNMSIPNINIKEKPGQGPLPWLIEYCLHVVT